MTYKDMFQSSMHTVTDLLPDSLYRDNRLGLALASVSFHEPGLGESRPSGRWVARLCS